jgi:hypothetical protein
VAADVGDFDESGARPLTFRRPEALDHVLVTRVRPNTDLLPILDAPGGGTADGSVHHLTASGFQPGEPLLLARCHRAVVAHGPLGRCEPLDRRAAFEAIAWGTVRGNGPRANARGRVSLDLTATAWIVPFPSSAAKPPPPRDPTADPGVDADGDLTNVFLAASAQLDSPVPDHRPGTPRPPEGIDCVAKPGTCVFVIAAAADSKRSAILPYTVTAGR